MRDDVVPALNYTSSTHDLNNFHSISNIYFISKVPEKVVASGIQSRMSIQTFYF